MSGFTAEPIERYARHMCGLGEPLTGVLLLYDALGMRCTRVKATRDPGCPLCGPSPEIASLIDYEEFCGVTTT
jgi:adenylyltransferase/sulfurtransferase